ncbi:hypothetical protein JWG42_06425 [Desulfoprunum benzoelyticum]|uniref:hypothetical protein n=1 Tax=Desulfoprunum benzoelyticum TaxID=1506996 RepID=UPI001962A401|nr:hypothetical protein [Desulfoprunum benzoelyticum]MBM9529785.1 hypothetical protein [Desulfoprunum benzoelyticum]
MNTMRRIVLASNEHESLARFVAGLGQNREVEIIGVGTAAAALDAVQGKPVHLVVVGEKLADTDPIDCVNRLVRLNPMINCAMISALAADDFHEATEGLGVLMQLPPNPSGDDAAALMAKVEMFSALLDLNTVQGART